MAMKKDSDPSALLELLEGLPDPRLDRTKKHKLVDILTIAICGALCGVDNFVELERFAQGIRNHWAVENSLHWILDVAFDEDRCRARMGHAAENLAIIRQAALNLIKQEKTVKVGMKTKRKMCDWDHNYMMLVLSGDPTRSG
jgi:predicted transposase YbfD/YdcC